MSAAFEFIADPARRRILDLLLDEERSVGAMVGDLGMSQPAVSKHLRVLREAGLVDARVDAQRRVYRLLPGRLVEIDRWIEPYRKLWSERLDDLGHRLDETAPREDG